MLLSAAGHIKVVVYLGSSTRSPLSIIHLILSYNRYYTLACTHSWLHTVWAGCQMNPCNNVGASPGSTKDFASFIFIFIFYIYNIYDITALEL